MLASFSSPLTDALTDALGSVAGQVVRGVKVESAWLPTIQVGLGAGDGGDGGAPALIDWGRILRPRITLDLTTGPVVIAPYGDPGPTGWPWPLLLPAALLAVAYYLGRRSRR